MVKMNLTSRDENKTSDRKSISNLTKIILCILTALVAVLLCITVQTEIMLYQKKARDQKIKENHNQRLILDKRFEEYQRHKAVLKHTEGDFRELQYRITNLLIHAYAAQKISDAISAYEAYEMTEIPEVTGE